jgi:hypothetical protein
LAIKSVLMELYLTGHEPYRVSMLFKLIQLIVVLIGSRELHSMEWNNITCTSY